ncbi:MAG: DUF1847 domain-containing protein [Candidatus Aminicenantes bacterium]|nr:DUF1847 domain-containing protein [Candidatus Aminicenantes bacterium]
MIYPKCAECKDKPCTRGETDPSILPAFCPIKNHKEVIDEVSERYASSDIYDFFLKSALTEKQAYEPEPYRENEIAIPVRPRVKELSAFAGLIGAKRLGLAFCSGLADEAGRASAILRDHGLDIVSVVCSCGALDKTALGIPADYKMRKPEVFEAACNPLLQAELLNRSETDFNIIVGLCVGHDMLFTRHSKAPVTTLIVKDRFTGHNPLISLYTRYHRFIR